MSGRRSSRSTTLLSAATLLDQVVPAHHALCRAMAEVRIDGAHYAALLRASEALHRLAADLGHPERMSAQPPRANLGR